MKIVFSWKNPNSVLYKITTLTSYNIQIKPLLVFLLLILNGQFNKDFNKSSAVDESEFRCTAECRCYIDNENHKYVDCDKRNLIGIPWLHEDSQIIDLGSNQITEISQTSFKYLTKALKIDLSNNDISHIHTGAFWNCRELRELKLHYNMIVDFPTFNPDNDLNLLYIQHNKISQLVPVFVNQLSHLIALDVSFNNLTQLVPGTFNRNNSQLRQLFLNNNHITHLHESYFDELVSLEWLKLSKNRLYHLPDSIFSKLSQLKYLELNRNKLSEIKSLTFKGLSSLEVLKMRRNDIKILKDGAFWGLTRIQNLQLDFNEIENVGREWLYGLAHLEKLSLANNRISSLKTEPWDTLPNLVELDISHNSLTNLEADTFKDLHSLKILNLAYNRIADAHLNTFSGLSNLQELDLSDNHFSSAFKVFESERLTETSPQSPLGNSISSFYQTPLSSFPAKLPSPGNNVYGLKSYELKSNLFCGLVNLKILKLARNEMSSLILEMSSNGCLLNLLSQLHSLDLADNPISYITMDSNSSSLPPLCNMREMILNSSYLVCDCDVLSLVPSWLTSTYMNPACNSNGSSISYHNDHISFFTSSTASSSLKCSHPYQLKGLDLIKTLSPTPNSGMGNSNTNNLTVLMEKFCGKDEEFKLAADMPFSDFNFSGFMERQSSSLNFLERNGGHIGSRYKSGEREVGYQSAAPLNKYWIDRPFPQNSVDSGHLGENSFHTAAILLPRSPLTLTIDSPSRYELVMGSVDKALTCLVNLSLLAFGSLDKGKIDKSSFVGVNWMKDGSSLGFDNELPSEKLFEVEESYTLEKGVDNSDNEPRDDNGDESNKPRMSKYTLTITSRLVFHPSVLDAHRGTYNCIASFLSSPNFPSSIYSLHSSTFPKDDRSQEIKSPRTDIIVLIAPHFPSSTTGLDPGFEVSNIKTGFGHIFARTVISVRVGGTARLECAASGRPRPRVAWQKVNPIKKTSPNSDNGYFFSDENRAESRFEIADFPAARERRMRVLHPSDSAFYISDVKPADAGYYICKAKNRAGAARLDLTLKVLELPYLSKPMNDQIITLGQSTVMECMAAGSPFPTVTWFKNGRILNFSKHVDFPVDSNSRDTTFTNNSTRVAPTADENIGDSRLTAVGQGRFLVLVRSQISDSGIYECVLQNTVGKVASSARLRVITNGADIPDSKDDNGDSHAQEGTSSPDPFNVMDLLNRANHRYLQSHDQIIPNQFYPGLNPNHAKDKETFLEEEEESESYGLDKPKDAVRIGSSDVGKKRSASKAHHHNTFDESVAPNKGHIVEIIVLAVVCCAVLTSCLWVFVIYRTRVKLNPHLKRRYTKKYDFGEISDNSASIKELPHKPIRSIRTLLRLGRSEEKRNSSKVPRNVSYGLFKPDLYYPGGWQSRYYSTNPLLRPYKNLLVHATKNLDTNDKHLNKVHCDELSTQENILKSHNNNSWSKQSSINLCNNVKNTTSKPKRYQYMALLVPNDSSSSSILKSSNIPEHLCNCREKLADSEIYADPTFQMPQMDLDIGGPNNALLGVYTHKVINNHDSIVNYDNYNERNRGNMTFSTFLKTSHSAPLPKDSYNKASYTLSHCVNDESACDNYDCRDNENIERSLTPDLNSNQELHINNHSMSISHNIVFDTLSSKHFSDRNNSSEDLDSGLAPLSHTNSFPSSLTSCPLMVFKKNACA
ncbi:unnamed protein product [Gordionus sp. m RMFG-2023]|uniref:uncharacterized protein LOC135923754 isoform X2 n=1 Tax=Gordionus sp. m RMFG-2023 TaxID=3053472 RepID=UPI0030E59BDF